MTINTLVCGSNIDEIERISRGLTDLGVEADYVNNGKDAQVRLSQSRFYAVIVDFNTVNNHSFEVIRYANINSPATRVFLLIDALSDLEKHMLTVEDVCSMGVIAVLEKPANPEVLLTHLLVDHLPDSRNLKSHTEANAGDEQEKLDQEGDEYTSIAIEEFYTGKVAIFDLYIRLRKDHNVKICRKGETFGHEEIEHYRNEKHVTHLYFKKIDRLLYTRRMTEHLNAIKREDINSHKAKTKLVGSLSSQFINEAYTDGLSPGIIKEATDLCQHVMELVEDDAEFNVMAKQLEQYSDDIYGHSTAVMFLATMICLQNDMSSKQTVDLISIGALFHDVGKTKLPIEISSKDPIMMTPEERAIYEDHPKLGVQVINEMTRVSEAVQQIIMQHHELYNGQGFPQKLSGLKIYPLAKVVSLADYVVHFMTTHKCSLKKAISFFSNNEDMQLMFDRQAFQCLIDIVKKKDI